MSGHERSRGGADQHASVAPELLEDSAEDLYDNAPCGYLSTAPDGTIVKVNQTFLDWTGYSRGALVGQRRFVDLMSVGGRVYHETHYAPLLRMQGSVREIAVELVRADGLRLPVLLNSVMKTDAHGRPLVTRTTVFNATDRRRYEEELLRQRERAEETSHTLQSALLPGRLPEVAGLSIAVRYLPGNLDVEVGGDFYDMVPLHDGRLAIIVGDVAGHDVTAAATMGQLRSAARALVGGLDGPAALIQGLQEVWGVLGLERIATGVFVFLRPETCELQIASAGHPPPLFVVGDEAWFAPTDPSPPLGVPGVNVEEWAGELPAGATMLMFTDGLVENRDLAIDDGCQRLVAAALDARTDDPERLCDHVLAAVAGDQRSDDVALLAVTARA